MKYVNKKTGEVVTVVEDNKKTKTVILEKADGKTISMTYPTLRKNWTKQEDEVVESSVESVVESSDEKVDEVSDIIEETVETIVTKGRSSITQMSNEDAEVLLNKGLEALGMSSVGELANYLNKNNENEKGENDGTV